MDAVVMPSDDNKLLIVIRNNGIVCDCFEVEKIYFANFRFSIKIKEGNNEDLGFIMETI